MGLDRGVSEKFTGSLTDLGDRQPGSCLGGVHNPRGKLTPRGLAWGRQRAEGGHRG